MTGGEITLLILAAVLLAAAALANAAQRTTATRVLLLVAGPAAGLALPGLVKPLAAVEGAPGAQVILVVAMTVLFALGMWQLLPRGIAPGRWTGAALVLASLTVAGALVPALAGWLNQSVFCALASITLLGAVATVSVRSPAYSAIWFALTLLGTSGLFLVQGAQFLAVATIVVYAGAIVVTILFVLMLAQPQGHSAYDSLSWEALLSAAAGALVVGMMTWTLGTTLSDPAATPAAAGELTAAANEETLADTVLSSQHVAGLGRQLFSRHLLVIEVAGTLLLVGLVGAVAIVAHDRSEHGGAAHHLEVLEPNESNDPDTEGQP